MPSRNFLIKTSKPKPLSAAGKASLAGRDQPAKDPKGPVIVPAESYTKKKELNRDLKPTNLTNLAASEQQRRRTLLLKSAAADLAHIRRSQKHTRINSFLVKSLN